MGGTGGGAPLPDGGVGSWFNDLPQVQDMYTHRAAMSVPMSACRVAALLGVFRHLPAAAAASDLGVGCPETARPADAGLHALGRPAEQQCTSIASSSSAADR